MTHPHPCKGLLRLHRRTPGAFCIYFYDFACELGSPVPAVKPLNFLYPRSHRDQRSSPITFAIRSSGSFRRTGMQKISFENFATKNLQLGRRSDLRAPDFCPPPVPVCLDFQFRLVV
jgi:hypothetical protein